MAVTPCTFYPALDLDMPFSLVAFIRSPITYIKTWLIYFFLDILATGPMPRHISFVMDGNRRYAKRLGKAGKDGHPDGFKNLLWVRIKKKNLNPRSSGIHVRDNIYIYSTYLLILDDDAPLGSLYNTSTQ